MEVLVAKDYDEMSRLAADVLEEEIRLKPDLVLGLATGSTPIGMYECLARAHAEHGLDFSQVKSFNLDEYVGLPPENPQSYHYFMKEHLFSKINIDPANTHFPTYNEEHPELSGAQYDEAIVQAGGIDVQILGIGHNGHIAFNEPDSRLAVNTGLVELSASTIEANSRFFESEDEVPKTAISSGMGTILKAKNLIILASGADKAKAVKQLLDGRYITTEWPVTLTLLHPRVILVIDEAAAGK